MEVENILLDFQNGYHTFKECNESLFKQLFAELKSI